MTISSMSLWSSLNSRSAPPQEGQDEPGSSTRRSRGVALDTRGRRRGLRSGVSSCVSSSSGSTASGSVSSGALVLSAPAIRRSSSANCSCSISRSTFSEDLPKNRFCNFAMRRRSVWISWSWARIVADIDAFWARNASIIAFNSAGSSGRGAASFDTPNHTANQPEKP